MNERENLAFAVKRIGIGYLFTYLAINLGTIDVLADWICWLLILKALPVLKDDEPSAALLRPFGIALFSYDLIIWALNIFGVSFRLKIVTILITIITLYFNFQLLTNLASIAEKYDCPQRKKLLTLRTVQAMLTTLLVLPFNIPKYEATTIMAWVFAIISLIIAFWICGTLFSLKKSLISVEDEENTNVGNGLDRSV